MKLTLIPGGRDDIERELVAYMFNPAALDQAKLDAIMKRLDRGSPPALKLVVNRDRSESASVVTEPATPES